MAGKNDMLTLLLFKFNPNNNNPQLDKCMCDLRSTLKQEWDEPMNSFEHNSTHGATGVIEIFLFVLIPTKYSHMRKRGLLRHHKVSPFLSHAKLAAAQQSFLSIYIRTSLVCL